MTDDQHTPVETAIYLALVAAESVEKALAEVHEADALNETKVAAFNDLCSGTLTADSFCRQNCVRLRTLALSLDPDIREQTVSWFVHDEHDMSGGHEEKFTSPQGDTLVHLRFAVRNLADSLSHVVRLQEAEQLAGLLD
ncbi:hypothetical protein [Marinovum sp.]|uniref:hypothetical protein n=1 Tax=Marinovum sp. TaxID=2024839 RepID=UPI003A948E95